MFSIFRRKNRQRSSVPHWPACSRHTRRTEAKRSRKFKCYLCLKVNLPREGLYKLLRLTFLMSVGILSSNYFSTLCLSSNICTGNTTGNYGRGDRCKQDYGNNIIKSLQHKNKCYLNIFKSKYFLENVLRCSWVQLLLDILK